MSKLQLKRLVGWVSLQVGMKCKTKVISNNAFGKVQHNSRIEASLGVGKVHYA